MDEIIETLHHAAEELLEWAEELNGYVGKGTHDAATLARVSQLLGSMCTNLGKVHDALAKNESRPDANDSPFDLMVKRVLGSRYSQASTELERFVREHRKTFERLKVPAAVIDRVIDALEVEMKPGGASDVEKPQGVEAWGADGVTQGGANPAHPKSPVVAIIREFRDLVCEISKVSDVAALLATSDLVGGIVQGVAGTALIVVDVTTVAAVAPHDISGWVLLKGVKSVMSGVSMVRKGLGRLREAWGSFRNRQAAAEKQKGLRDEAQKSRFRLGEKPEEGRDGGGEGG